MLMNMLLHYKQVCEFTYLHKYKHMEEFPLCPQFQNA